MSPSGSSRQTSGTASSGKSFCRRASRNRFSGSKTEGAAKSFPVRIGGAFDTLGATRCYSTATGIVGSQYMVKRRWRDQNQLRPRRRSNNFSWEDRTREGGSGHAREWLLARRRSAIGQRGRQLCAAGIGLPRPRDQRGIIRVQGGTRPLSPRHGAVMPVGASHSAHAQAEGARGRDRPSSVRPPEGGGLGL